MCRKRNSEISSKIKLCVNGNYNSQSEIWNMWVVTFQSDCSLFLSDWLQYKLIASSKRIIMHKKSANFCIKMQFGAVDLHIMHTHKTS